MKPAKRQCFCCSAVGRQVAGGSVVACVVMVGSFLRASGRGRGRATADGWPSQPEGEDAGWAMRWGRSTGRIGGRDATASPTGSHHHCGHRFGTSGHRSPRVGPVSAIPARRRTLMLAGDLRRTATGAGGEARRFWWAEARRETGVEWLRSFCSGWRRRCARLGLGSVYGRTTILPWRWPDWLASSAAAVRASG